MLVIFHVINNICKNVHQIFYCFSVGKWSKADVKDALEALEEKGLTRAMSEGLYIRQHSIDTQVN